MKSPAPAVEGETASPEESPPLLLAEHSVVPSDESVHEAMVVNRWIHVALPSWLTSFRIVVGGFYFSNQFFLAHIVVVFRQSANLRFRPASSTL